LSSSRPFAGLEPVALNSATRDQVLLRAATDHFANGRAHEPDAVRQFEELAIHYLPRTTVADRIYVSERLASRTDAPVAVMRLLARDVIAVAAPVLLRSKALTTLDLLMVISGTSLEHHRLLAQRETLPSEVITALRLKNETGTLNILRARGLVPEAKREAKAEAPAKAVETAARIVEPTKIVPRSVTGEAKPETSRPATVGAAPKAAPTAEAAKPIFPEPARPLAPLPAPEPAQPVVAESEAALPSHPAGEAFLALGRAERLKIIAETAGGRLPSSHWSSPRKLERLVKTTFRRSQIKGFVRARKRPELVEALSDGLDLSPAFVTRCLDDRSGEPMVLLARAMGLNQPDGKDLLLLVNPVIGHSVPDFIRLADLHDAMEPEVAESIIAGWRGESVGKPEHVSVLSNAAGARRAAATESGRLAETVVELGKASA
jgi:hypothetical protein